MFEAIDCHESATAAGRKAVQKPVSIAARFFALFAMFACAGMTWAQTAVPVYTWRYDNTHAGQNTTETVLTTANVNPTTFGKLFSLPVDSTIYAQPLYVPGLTMSDGKVHNVLFVATENDSIYAFDADSNGGANSKAIWKATLLDAAHGAAAGATSVPYLEAGNQGDIGPTIGITGTPVIDPATNTMYVVGKTKENGSYFHRLHAINILTGAEQPTSQTLPTNPVLISATVAGNGQGSSAGQLPFDQLLQNQRPALSFHNGYVYVAFASHGDNGIWHGWLFSYNAATLAQSAVLCLSPNGEGAGIWGSGAALPIDDDVAGGRMFLSTGNGDADTNLAIASSKEFGESILTINLANGGLTPADAFTSYNATGSNSLNTEDVDQGSGGVLMLPDQAGANAHELLQAGKEGRVLVLNRDNLGGYNKGGTSNPGALQDITGQTTGLWSTPAYWNGKVYMWGSKGYPQIWDLDNGVLGNAPFSQSSIYSDFPGASFSISSNGTENGIAWAVRTDQFKSYGTQVLYAWDATDLTTPIYESDTKASRDSAGQANKFSIPVVTNGKVYVWSHGAVNVYGLLNATPVTAAPVISPDGGSFAASQSVTITSTTANANIYYTLDGTTPTTASTLYTAAITVSTGTTINAIASASGYTQSTVSTATFTFTNQTPAVTFSPAGGSYTAAQTVTLSDTDTSAVIHYTIDGTTPTAASTSYTGPITVAASETINAIAIDPSETSSNVATAIYNISAGGNTIDFSNGFSSTNGLQLNGNTLADNDTRLQLTNGNLNEASSVFWNSPINIQAFTTTFKMQLSPTSGQPANGMTFTIQNVGPTALGGSSSGLGYGGIGQSVAVKFNFYNFDNEGADSVGFYTNGQAPVLPSIDISSSGIQLGNGDTVTATLTYDGTTLTLTLMDPLANNGAGGTFTTSKVIDIPGTIGSKTAYVGFTGGSGGLSASQKLTYWTYTTQALPPTFSVAAGTYTTAQNVALASGTSDAVIYYTTDGTTPTGASTKYTTPIAVSATETINAIAISPTMGTSQVESAAYVLNLNTASGSFVLSNTSPAAISQGATATSTITVTPSNGFTGAVALSCAITSAPAGAAGAPACSVTQPAAITSGATTATLTFTTLATTTAGTYSVTVTGTSSKSTAATVVPMIVTSPTVTPNFTMAGTSVALIAGASGNSTITITPSGGFTGIVSLGCKITSSPAGSANPPTCTVAQPTAVSGTAAVTAAATVSSQAATTAGSYTVTITGIYGSLSNTATVPLTITAPVETPDFAMAGTSVSLTAGASGSSTITITPSGGFTGSVTLACAITAPTGAANAPTCAVAQPTAVSGSAAVTAAATVTTQSGTTAGTYTMTVTGTDGSLSHTASVPMTITAPTGNPTFALSGTAVNITSAGTPATSTITVTPSGGFTGSVGLTCALTSSPTGATDLPTCTVTQPTAISGSTAVTATVTINTTGATVASNRESKRPFDKYLSLGGGGTLAVLLFFGLPIRRRKWLSMVGMLLLMVAAMVASGCGGSTKLSTTSTGTTSGAYVVTVTGTAGSATQTTSIAVTVQ